MKRLHKNVFVHTTADGMNIGCVVGEDAIACVDLPLDPQEARAWRAQLADAFAKPIRAVIFTTAARLNGEALAAMEAPSAVLHEASFAQPAVPSEPISSPTFEPPPMSNAGMAVTSPQLTFSDAMSIVLGTRHPTFVDVVFQGGYAPDACFVIPRDSGIVFAGDHVAIGQPPNLSHADVERWQIVLTALKKDRTVATVVPGRGPVTEPAAGVEETLDYIKTATARVKALVRAHRSRAEVAALVPDLMALYVPKPARGKPPLDLDAIGRHMHAGLEHLYDELQTNAGTEP